jgi:hypothetical protein
MRGNGRRRQQRRRAHIQPTKGTVTMFLMSRGVARAMRSRGGDAARFAWGSADSMCRSVSVWAARAQDVFARSRLGISKRKPLCSPSCQPRGLVLVAVKAFDFLLRSPGPTAIGQSRCNMVGEGPHSFPAHGVRPGYQAPVSHPSIRGRGQGPFPGPPCCGFPVDRILSTLLTWHSCSAPAPGLPASAAPPVGPDHQQQPADRPWQGEGHATALQYPW